MSSGNSKESRSHYRVDSTEKPTVGHPPNFRTRSEKDHPLK